MRRPSLIIAVRSQVRSISSKIWEDIKIVFPRCFSSNTNSIKRFCINGSNPLLGSSKINSSGSCIKAQIIPIFCFIPLDIFFIFPCGLSSKRSINSYALVKSVIPFIFAINLINSRPVISSMKAISPGR